MQTKKWEIQVVVLCLCVGVGSTCLGKVIYVDADATGANDGSSWADAYNDLQDALSAADGLAKPVEIRVAQGTYRPDWRGESPMEAFELIDGVAVKGGYAGFGQPDPNARDIELYKTILSGDLSQNDIEVADPCDLLSEPTRAENSYHVVLAYGVGETAVLDGCTIVGGNANGASYGYDYGGGMYCVHGSATVADCTFVGNSAVYGGGISTWERPIFTRCSFNGNSAQDGGGMYYHGVPILIECRFTRNTASGSGGAIGSYDAGHATMVGCVFEKNRAPAGGGIGGQLSEATLTDCTFIDNSGYSGGGIWGVSYYFSLSGCTFTGNSASEAGGAITNYWSGLILTNCSFRGNSAFETGGAIATYNTQAILSNCTFGGNRAEKGAALVSDDYYYYDVEPEDVQITNCILWDSGNQIWNDECSVITVRYSNIKGGQASIYDPCEAVVWGEGNIDADPCFADPGYWDPNGTPEDVNDDFWVDGDYHLKSQAGRWEPNEGQWAIDDVTSPCIDAGDPMSPIGLEPFPNGGRINMGAYGGTEEASKSYFGEPPCETIVAGDINGDCQINFEDFRLMALHWCEDYN